MKFLLVIIIAAVAVGIAIIAYIRKCAEVARVRGMYIKENDRLYTHIRERTEERDAQKKKNASLRMELDISNCERAKMFARCEKLADENLRLMQCVREYEDGGRIIVVDDRKVYFERDGIRHIFFDNEYQGWYDPEHEVVEVDEDGLNAPMLTNYRWLRSLSVEEMADLIDNFEELLVRSCKAKYCSLAHADGTCAPVPEGMTRKEACKAATVKWLLDLHEEPEDKPPEGTGE